ncbi:TPA: 3-dehydro-L-gulonate 2-dehydrogenase [Candidatus Latescibacteria bacterium]|nr:3-dehydro-L-gulonate 2-dehydrogenase [Gemmatimonadota bacterium]HAA75586.1 3-dehydro-L-gulonate 2-dehydrogenase [Candidatus Latescibacterota bacterium]|tara:strand:- start:7040 stop:8044 length:1005 start_codon:yes stop_codon:yes gene_type:complete
MERIPFETVHAEFRRVLESVGFTEAKADRTAQLFAENTRDGVYSHGLNRFAGFVRGCQNGKVRLDVEAECVHRMGVIEQWDGKTGIGLLNAEAAMGRAIEIAHEHGVGCVGLRNTNHWMRAGAYGLQAADAGCIGICWTNTTVLMPPWGSAEKRIGNNPLTLCVPYLGNHILLDMAMSQYSNGKLEVLKRRGESLPLAGGYDEAGDLTTDPGAILDSKRALPIGYWKGSGLALILDLMGTLISGGDSTQQISARPDETNVSQVYMAIDVGSLSGQQIVEETVNRIVTDFQDVSPLDGISAVRYPGEGMLATRRDNLANGIPVDPDLWSEVLEMP